MDNFSKVVSIFLGTDIRFVQEEEDRGPRKKFRTQFLLEGLESRVGSVDYVPHNVDSVVTLSVGASLMVVKESVRSLDKLLIVTMFETF